MYYNTIQLHVPISLRRKYWNYQLSRIVRLSIRSNYIRLIKREAQRTQFLIKQDFTEKILREITYI